LKDEEVLITVTTTSSPADPVSESVEGQVLRLLLRLCFYRVRESPITLVFSLMCFGIKRKLDLLIFLSGEEAWTFPVHIQGKDETPYLGQKEEQ
jgi:hypothetical protein